MGASRERSGPGEQVMTETYLGLGSNLGDRAANLWEAARRLCEVPGCTVERLSLLYETAPVGPQNQGWFLNAVVRADVSLSPRELLAAAKRIELEMGRQPSERWGPRLIDIDLLLFSDESIQSDDLIVPHPELWNRRFVLVPLADVLPIGPTADRVRTRLVELGDEQELRSWPLATTV
jgi:2-amino-4-hydroxy-6-hydroxymethyldihydropteridine diphosphokinase